MLCPTTLFQLTRGCEVARVGVSPPSQDLNPMHSPTLWPTEPSVGNGSSAGISIEGCHSSPCSKAGISLRYGYRWLSRFRAGPA